MGFGPKPRPIADRFWEHTDRGSAEDCWLWRGHLTKGYGRLHVASEGRHLMAHRVAYELCVGPIPEGLVLDHLCRNRACVNPSHLEAVTDAENIRRGERATKTHCIRGHEFTEENTYRASWGRACRACNAIRQEAFKARRMEEAS